MLDSYCWCTLTSDVGQLPLVHLTSDVGHLLLVHLTSDVGQLLLVHPNV